MQNLFHLVFLFFLVSFHPILLLWYNNDGVEEEHHIFKYAYISSPLIHMYNPVTVSPEFDFKLKKVSALRSNTRIPVTTCTLYVSITLVHNSTRLLTSTIRRDASRN